MYIPDKGDIIWLNFEPSAGKEITKRRPAFVISRKAFNEHTGFAIVAPITSTVRGIRLEVKLEGVKTEGAILNHHVMLRKPPRHAARSRSIQKGL